jgi:ATP adenylyltransferase
MNHIFSPWRMKYIANHKKAEGCIFCIALSQTDDAANLILYRGQKAFMILNRFPYTSGHLMIVPFDHQPSLELLDSETRAEIMELAAQAIRIIQVVYRPEGYNLGVNIGEVAGAGITDHVHLHVVPRWAGDTNFMSTLGQTRVMPETLEDTYKRLRDGWEDIKRDE